MSKLIELKDSILWHDGMMLTAQHFNSMSSRFEQILHYKMGVVTPYNWGVKNYEIDDEQLSNGKLVVSRLEAILPDGMIIHDSSNERNILELDLASQIIKESQKVLKVYLFVPAEFDDEYDYENNIRYKQIMPEIIDEGINVAEDNIPYQRPNLSLQLLDEIPESDSCMPLVHVNYSNGQFSLTEFVPPTLTVNPLSGIWRIVSNIIQKIKIKALFLSKQIPPSSVQHDPIILDKRLLLQNLISQVPYLEAQMQSGYTHPYKIYLTLCQLLGNLSSIGYELILTNTINYNHNDLFNTFIQFRNLVYQILDESIGDKFHSVPFEREENIFSLNINKHWLSESLIVGISATEDKTEKDILNWMLNCIIGSEEDISKMKKERTIGVQRNQITKDSNFPPTLDKMFFVLETNFIKPDQKLIIFNPSDSTGEIVPEKINLYVKKRFDI